MERLGGILGGLMLRRGQLKVFVQKCPESNRAYGVAYIQAQQQKWTVFLQYMDSFDI